MRFSRQRILIIGFLALCGCATAGQKGTLLNHSKSQESQQEAVSALGSVAGAMSGQELTEDDLRKVAHQVQKDPEAKQAVASIAEALNSKGTGVKYCPIDGRRYDGHFSKCPDHGVNLIELGE